MKGFYYAFWNNLYFLGFVCIVLLCIIAVFTYGFFLNDLTSKERIMNRKDTGVILVDRNKKPFFSFYEAKEKHYVPLSLISPITQQAVIASEDKEFYSHPGFSLRGIIRSFFRNVQNGNTTYGGSTITQQLVKNSLLSSRKSFIRKYQEVLLAMEIERRFSKQEILEMYLNSVYFGEGAFGIEEAAQTYFGKSSNQLNLTESSMLAALLPLPSHLSPLHGDKTELIKRQHLVLEHMKNQRYISENQYRAALYEPLSFTQAKQQMNRLAPHFALFVRDFLREQYGEEYIARSGLTVKTTLDSNWQEITEETVKEQVAKLSSQNVTNGAVVVIDPKTGEVRVMVGSVDWYNTEFGKVNVAISKRPPGSAFKPIIYAKAFEKNIITPATILHDKPTTFQRNYKPKNFDNQFRGNVTARRALANSLNVPSVEVMSKIGVTDGIEMAQRLGITTIEDPSQYGLSLVLGAGEVKLLELTNAYATFANKGVRNDITTILEIHDKNGNILYTHSPHTLKVLDDSVAFLVSSILSDIRARQEIFGSTLTIPRPAAVKTGTTEDYKDSLTIGYTPSLTVGVWVGNNNNTAMEKVAGSLGAAPIWKKLMQTYLKNTIAETFDTPPGIIAQTICITSPRGTISAQRTEYFLVGTVADLSCTAPKKRSLPRPTLTPTPQPVAKDSKKHIGGENPNIDISEDSKTTEGKDEEVDNDDREATESSEPPPE